MNDITYVGRHATVYSVSRHFHESWEYVYCTGGSGTFFFDDESLFYRKGDVVVIPPMTPHSNAGEQGFTNFYLNMTSPTLTLKSPALIADDSNRFLLNAFSAAFYHFYADESERAALLSCYGSLISYYLSAYQTMQPRTGIVCEIKRNIISSYSDCDYRLDAYLESLPFSFDYLRKQFQKAYGVTPHQYLVNKRLQIAAEALVNAGVGSSLVSDIALMCGFRDPLYFSRLFKKKYGVSPSRFCQLKQSEQKNVPSDSDSMKIMLADV